MKKYIVRLDAEERSRLEQLAGTGKSAAYRIRHASILLAADKSEAGPKMKDVDAARAFNVAVRSGGKWQAKCLHGGAGIACIEDDKTAAESATATLHL